MRPSRCFLLLGVLFGMAAIPSWAAEWTIPVGGNVFRTAPEPGGARLRGRAGLRLNEQDHVYTLFFRADRPAQLKLALQGRVSSGEATVAVRVGKQAFTARLASETLELAKVGTVQVKTPGYVRVDVQATSTSGEGFAELQALVVSSETEQLVLDFVKTNDGNMFYWGRRGPSVHLRYDVPRDIPLEVAYCEVTVPRGEDPLGSFFMACGFGEGYFGFQVNRPTERRVLFSVWSPFRTNNPHDIPAEQRIAALAKGEGVHIGEFGNEGSGGQSYLRYPWKAGRPHRFLLQVRPDGTGSTVYTAWFGPPETKQWKLIASFRRPKTDTHLRGFHSFLESFLPSHGHIGRRAQYGNVWVRDTGGKWHACRRARFSVDATGRGRHRLDFAGGTDGNSFYLRNCGFFADTVEPGKAFALKSMGKPPQIDWDALPRGKRPEKE